MNYTSNFCPLHDNDMGKNSPIARGRIVHLGIVAVSNRNPFDVHRSQTKIDASVFLVCFLIDLLLNY